MSLLDVLDKAKGMAKSGDLAGAAKYLSANAGMSETQATENLKSYYDNRPAVNTSDSSGLWGGTTTQGNVAGAPTSVMATTATPSQQSAAAALSAIANKPVEQPKVAAQPAMQTQSQPAPFNYNPSAQTMNASQLNSEAQRQAQYAADVQRQALVQALARKVQGYDQAMTKLPDQLNQAWKANDEEAARTGFYTSGRRFALRDASNTAMQNNLADILSQKNLAITEAGDAERAIANNQTQQYLNILDALRRDERNYALQDRAQQYNEYSGDRNYGLDYAKTNSDLANAAFQLSRGQQLLPYELQNAGLGNQLTNAQIQSALLGNQAKQLELYDQYDPSGIGYQTRLQGLTSAQLANEKQTLANKAEQLQNEINNNPDYGAKANAYLAYQQAQKQLQLVDAQISAENALATQRASGEGLTPYQKYQIGQDQQAQQDKTNESQIKGYTDNYAIGRDAAQVWVDYQNLLSEGNPYTGKPFTDQEKAAVINQMTRGLNQNDVEWVNAMWHSANGEAWYNQYLTNFLKSVIGDKAPQLYGQLPQ